MANRNCNTCKFGDKDECGWDCQDFNAWEKVEEETPEMVYKPKHYNSGKVEVIDILDQACEGLTGLEGGYVFTVLRYLLRWKHKGGIEDLKKAHNYLGRLLNILEDGKHEWRDK